MRWIAIGDVQGRILTVVFALREERVRLISARRARRVEAALYTANLPR